MKHLPLLPWLPISDVLRSSPLHLSSSSPKRNSPCHRSAQVSVPIFSSCQFSAALFADVLLSAFLRRFGPLLIFFMNVCQGVKTKHEGEGPLRIPKCPVLTRAYALLFPPSRMKVIRNTANPLKMRLSQSRPFVSGVPKSVGQSDRSLVSPPVPHIARVPVLFVVRREIDSSGIPITQGQL